MASRKDERRNDDPGNRWCSGGDPQLRQDRRVLEALGFELEFETDHHSGRLRHPAGGPYIFVAERPPQQTLQVVLGVSVASAELFQPPASGTVLQPFEKQHWGALQLLVADPDGRVVAVEAPAPREGGAP